MKTGFTVNEWSTSHEGQSAATGFSFVGISGMKRFRTGNEWTDGKSKCHVKLCVQCVMNTKSTLHSNPPPACPPTEHPPSHPV